MAKKISGLRRWKNNEVLTARDYLYERDTIVEAINDQEDEAVVLEGRVTDVEQKNTEQDGRLDAAEGRLDTAEGNIVSLQTDKADKATTYTKIETNAEIDGSVSTHDADAMAHPAIRQKITDDINSHNVSGTSHMDIREAKLDKSVFEEFITNFDLEGDM